MIFFTRERISCDKPGWTLFCSLGKQLDSLFSVCAWDYAAFYGFFLLLFLLLYITIYKIQCVL
jgi:hypothetical protein